METTDGVEMTSDGTAPGTVAGSQGVTLVTLRWKTQQMAGIRKVWRCNTQVELSPKNPKENNVSTETYSQSSRPRRLPRPYRPFEGKESTKLSIPLGQIEDVEVITHRPGWLTATQADGYLFVYRSVLVTDHSPMYQIVYDRLDDYNLLARYRVEDETMQHGAAEELVFCLWEKPEL